MSEMLTPPLTGLRSRRVELGVSQEEAGKLLGINKSHYGKFELGHNRLSYEQARTLAKALSLNMEDFREEVDADRQPISKRPSAPVAGRRRGRPRKDA